MAETLTIEPDAPKETDVEVDALPEWAASVLRFVTKAARAGETVNLTAEPRMFTPAEAADRLGISRATVSRRIAAGELQSVKVGNRHRIQYDELNRFWRSLMQEIVDEYADDIANDLADT